VAAVRLIVARCEVRYTGRLTAVLPEALRLLMLKSDGSVIVHADTACASRAASRAFAR
jgi:RecB family endonuclease NucS